VERYSPWKTPEEIDPGVYGIRVRYLFNLWVDPSTRVRLYQRMDDLIAEKVLALDILLIPEWNAHTETGPGWNVLYQDGSARFASDSYISEELMNEPGFGNINWAQYNRALEQLEKH